LPKNLPLRRRRKRARPGEVSATENTEGRKRIRHGFTLIHTAGRELLAENGGQTMEDGRQKRRLKIKSLSPDLLAQCRPDA